MSPNVAATEVVEVPVREQEGIVRCAPPARGHVLTREFLHSLSGADHSSYFVGEDCFVASSDRLAHLQPDGSLVLYTVARPEELRRRILPHASSGGRQRRPKAEPLEPCTLPLGADCLIRADSPHYNPDEYRERLLAGDVGLTQELRRDLGPANAERLLESLRRPPHPEAIPSLITTTPLTGWGGTDRVPAWTGNGWTCPVDVGRWAEGLLRRGAGWMFQDIGPCRWVGVRTNDLVHYVLLGTDGDPVTTGVWTLGEFADLDDRIRWARVLRSADALPPVVDIRTAASPSATEEAETAFADACSRRDWREGVWALRTAFPERLHGLEAYEVLRWCEQPP